MDMTYFNAEKTRDELVAWLKKWFDENGRDCKAVIGISGGKDSTIVAALCARAIGKERVRGVLMPNGEQKDIADSIRVCDAIGIDYLTVNIGNTYQDLLDEVSYGLGSGTHPWNADLTAQTKINLAPRLRTATLYAVSQTIGGRVINTSNRSEYMNGYFTRWGDECGDCKPLINLTVNEVVAIGKTMKELPVELVEKAPSDGLTGLTDEDKIGYTYDDTDKCIYGEKIDETVKAKIMANWEKSAFKRSPVPAFVPSFHAPEIKYGYLHIDEKDKDKFPEPTIVDMRDNILRVKMDGVYIEDAVVNGHVDSPAKPEIPGYNGRSINWEIEPDTGTILNWRPGTTAKVNYKVCDEFSYDYQGFHYGPNYVPHFMEIDSAGWGDYVCLTIDKDGKIANWSKDRFLDEHKALSTNHPAFEE